MSQGENPDMDNQNFGTGSGTSEIILVEQSGSTSPITPPAGPSQNQMNRNLLNVSMGNQNARSRAISASPNGSSNNLARGGPPSVRPIGTSTVTNFAKNFTSDSLNGQNSSSGGNLNVMANTIQHQRSMNKNHFSNFPRVASDQQSKSSVGSSVRAMSPASNPDCIPLNPGLKMPDCGVTTDAEEIALSWAQTSSFMSCFSVNVAQKFLEIATTIDVKKGKTLYKAGDRRDKFYIINEGLLRLTRHETTGQTNEMNYSTIGTFTRGDCLCETSLYIDTHKRHTTEALAINDTIVDVFLIDDIKRIAMEEGIEFHLQVVAGIVAAERIHKKIIKVQGHRIESDSAGDVKIPITSYIGKQTQRCINMMGASGVKLNHYPTLVNALAIVKKSCALANQELGYLDPAIAAAICQACDEISEGNLHDEFCTDLLQGGGGISTMANANEVIANRATELLGGNLGDYMVDSNEHVNLSQSDDAYHTTIRLAIILYFPQLEKSICQAIHALYQKAIEFKDIVKMGRTMMQDAVPLQLGREFLAWARQLEDDYKFIVQCKDQLKECTLGGTMLGTGLGSQSGFSQSALKHLREQSSIKDFETPKDLIKAATDLNSIVGFSSSMRRIAVRVSKICNDLRLQSSGPRCGLKEINLPEMQPGSSIMPGKVNPVIPEAMSQVCFNVIGNDTTVALAAEGGQLNACIFDTVITFSVLESMQIMSRGLFMLNKNCLQGITANEKICRKGVDASVSKLTAATSVLGYAQCSEIAEAAIERNCSVESILQEKKLLTYGQIKNEIFSDRQLLAASYNDDTENSGQISKTVLQELRLKCGNEPIPKPIWHEEPDSTAHDAALSKVQNFDANSEQNKFKPPRRNSVALTVSDRDKLEALVTNEIFGGLDITTLASLLEHMQIVNLEGGDYLYRSGDEQKYIYLIKQGVVRSFVERLTIRTDSTKSIVEKKDISVHSDGSSITNASLMETVMRISDEGSIKAGRRNISAVAEVTSIVYKMELSVLERHFFTQPEARQILATRVSKVLYNRLISYSSGATLTRMDADLLGSRKIPINVYWGVQTLRAKENFHLTGITTEQFPALQKAFAYVKKACAIVNRDQGTISEEQGRGIIMACDEIINGKLNAQFVTDMIQGGAGTSTNMNANVVFLLVQFLRQKNQNFLLMYQNQNVSLFLIQKPPIFFS